MGTNGSPDTRSLLRGGWRLSTAQRSAPNSPGGSCMNCDVLVLSVCVIAGAIRSAAEVTGKTPVTEPARAAAKPEQKTPEHKSEAAPAAVQPQQKSETLRFNV